MIKRILALFCAIITLVSLCVISVGAEEATEQEGIDVYSLSNECVNIEAPLYYFTIRVGDRADWMIHGFKAYDYRCVTNAVVTAHNGVFSSGKHIGDVTYTNDIDGTIHQLVVGQGPESAKHMIVGFGAPLYGEPAFFIKAEGGVITHIGGLVKGVKGADFDAITVAFSVYTYEGADNTANVAAFAQKLESLGIDVDYDKGLRTSGILGWLFDGFTSSIIGLASGIKQSATNLIYENGITGPLSTVIRFIFIIAGLSIAMTVFFMVFRLIRFNRQR